MALEGESTEVETPDPPFAAELLLSLFLTKKRADAVIGDLNEQFHKNCLQCTPARARRLYWRGALRSVGPLLMRAIGRAIRLGAFAEFVRRLITGA